MRILVTGASGFIGSRFCTLAAEAGHDITALIRPGGRSSYPVGRIVYGQLPYDIPQRAWEGIEALVHCAAATTGQDPAESEAINVAGTSYLLSQGAKLAPRLSRIVFLSSQSAHEAAVSSYGITKRAGEQLVRQSALPYAILRPGLVIGPGKTGLFYRMRRTVERLPILPLLGGGKALVQPIHVDDLCIAMLRCLGLPPEHSPELFLGEPQAMTLREFLQAAALAKTGRKKPELLIPLGPLKLAVRTGEALHLPMPISTDNLLGMEKVQSMDTAPSLEKLQMKLRPFSEAIRDAIRDEAPAPPAHLVRERPLRILLIGAGKIGIVHALNLTRREETTLCGIVDRNKKAFGLYRSMGFRAPFRTDLDSALKELRPDGAIVATPASTHYDLAKWCVEKDLPVLVEKPMTIRPEGLERFDALRRQFPEAVCHVGYMAAQYPHLDKAGEILTSGELGPIRAFWAFGLQSHIMASKPVRWEMVKAQSGGGTLINFAGHVLSILVRLFGLPAECETRMWTLHSVDVEDAIEVRFNYGLFPGRLFASWSIPGYPRPENRIVVVGENATLTIENYCVSLKRADKIEAFWTQQDFDTGYNAAPDYTGAGFSMEHTNFARAIRRRSQAKEASTQAGSFSNIPVDVAEASRLEQLIFELYSHAGSQDAKDARWQQSPAPGVCEELDQQMDKMIASLLP